MKLKGRGFLLQLGTDEVTPDFTTIAHFEELSLNQENGAVDVTDKDSEGNRELLSGAGIRSCTISGAGNFNNQASFLYLQSAVALKSQRIYRVVSNLGDTYKCRFRVTEFSRNGDYDGAEKFSVKLESADTLIYTPVSLP